MRENVEANTEKHQGRGCSLAYSLALEWFKKFEKKCGPHAQLCDKNPSLVPLKDSRVPAVPGADGWEANLNAYFVRDLPKVGGNKTMYYTHILL